MPHSSSFLTDMFRPSRNTWLAAAVGVVVLIVFWALLGLWIGLLLGIIAFVLMSWILWQRAEGVAPAQTLQSPTPAAKAKAAEPAPKPAPSATPAPEPTPAVAAPAAAPPDPVAPPLAEPSGDATAGDAEGARARVRDAARAAGEAARLMAEPAEAPASSEAVKPAGLPGPREGGADDLKKIKGVGPKIEEMLHGLGVYHFDQIAAWGPGEVAWVDSNLEGFHGRATRDDWVGQAKVLATGGTTEFSARVDRGEVYE